MVFSDISSIKQSQEKLAYLAHHDHLTDFPNRLLFNKHLEQSIELAHRNHTQIAVFFLDLDHFKDVNDTFGHVVGDQLLRSVATRIRNVFRVEDIVARLGGDEFIIVVSGLENPKITMLLAEKLLALFKTPSGQA